MHIGKASNVPQESELCNTFYSIIHLSYILRLSRGMTDTANISQIQHTSKKINVYLKQ